MNSQKAIPSWSYKGKTYKDIVWTPPNSQQKIHLTDEIIDGLTPDELYLLKYDWGLIGRRKQQIPDCDWRVWVILAGRGFGKSRTATEFIKEQALLMPDAQGMIVTRTAGDIQKTFVNGESGLIKTARPDFMPRWKGNENCFVYPNGHRVWAVTAENPNQIRGPSVYYSVADEFASWSRAEEAWDNIQYATREGKNARIVAISTPRPTDFVKQVILSQSTIVTTGTTWENAANLDPRALAALKEKYEGTSIGAQELEAQILGDKTGNLFSQSIIDRYRINNTEQPATVFANKLQRIVVAVDPAVTSNEHSDATGIVVMGEDADGTLIVLDDYTTHGTPTQWASNAVSAFDRYSADRVIVETNNGGEMCELTLKTQMPNLPVTRVTASRGKLARAEPIAALYEQGKIRHYNHLPELENEMIFYTPGQRNSPNRMDAMVWAASFLGAIRQKPGQIRSLYN